MYFKTTKKNSELTEERCIFSKHSSSQKFILIRRSRCI